MISTLCHASASLAQNAPKIFECNGGVVSDKETAIRITEAILFPVYGENAICEQRPYQVTLNDGKWTVDGNYGRVLSAGVFTSLFSNVMLASLRLATISDSGLFWMQ
jgi:NTF2 fold immunity protein